MKHFLWASLLFGGACMLVTEPAHAQMFRRPLRGCCETCELPHANCTCSQTRPVVQTELRAQQVTTIRDVTETHVRNETVIQNVPVTTYKQVTVDEGNYQMVWVPKPVTRQVAQTVTQQQAQTRAVPYQVTRRVPQVSTQLVPVQTVHHVTETVPMQAWAPPVMMQATNSCNVCNSPFATAVAPTYVAPSYGVALAPAIQYAPPAPTIATMPAITVPVPQAPQTARGPLPPPENSTEQWQTIPSRSAPASRPYEAPGARSVPVPMEEARVTPRASKFTPAPSAATVWNQRQQLR